MRIHQSGHMGVLAADKKAIVKEELDYYKQMRQDIPKSIPFWPLGLAKDEDDWMALGLKGGEKNYLAVYHMQGETTCKLPLKEWKGKELDVKVAFPASDSSCKVQWHAEEGMLEVTLPEEEMARILEF